MRWNTARSAALVELRVGHSKRTKPRRGRRSARRRLASITAFGCNARLLYVGMTRARERLILTASEETACTERLSSIAA